MPGVRSSREPFPPSARSPIPLHYAIANYSQQSYGCGGRTVINGRVVVAGRALAPQGGFQTRLAAQSRHALAVRSLRLDRPAPAPTAVAKPHAVSRARLSGRGRLHGPRQLGDLARGRLEVRLRAALHRAALEPDGDPAAGAVRAARH